MVGRILFCAFAALAVCGAFAATPIRFGTWNIRLASMDRWEKDPKFPKWEERMPHVTDLVKAKGFDLMGLQEVATPQAEFIRGSWLSGVEIENVRVTGVEGPLVRLWNAESARPVVKAAKVTGVGTDVVPATGPWDVRGI